MSRKILILGASYGSLLGMKLALAGHDVTLMSRSAPGPECLRGFAHIAGNYVDDDVSTDALSAFDQLVFAAGADIRQVPPGADESAFYQRVNAEAIPRFFARARAAGFLRGRGPPREGARAPRRPGRPGAGQPRATSRTHTRNRPRRRRPFRHRWACR